MTEDIDTFNDFSAALETALEPACERTGMDPLLARSGIAQAPEGYETRGSAQSLRATMLPTE
jgi:hypothetical protein